MLGKLLKYEIKATSRVFLPLYSVLIVFSIINCFMNFNPDYFSTSQFISLTLYILILAGMFVASIIVMIQRFYKNLLSEEGYLMFTLPVESWKHIVGKLITTLMWIVLSCIMALLSILIIASQGINFPEFFADIRMIWDTAYSYFGASLYHFIIQMIIGFIVAMVSGILLIYVSIAIGHLSNNHKKLLSIGAFIGIYTVGQIISATLFIGNFGHRFEFRITQQSPFPFTLVWQAIGVSAAFAAIYFVITNIILNKRLNLE